MRQVHGACGLFRASLLISASPSALLLPAAAFPHPANQPPAPPVDQSTVSTANDQKQALQTPPANPGAGSSSADTAGTESKNESAITGPRIKQSQLRGTDTV